ncbi:MAG TPA: FAD-dependent oxidoreductase [Thermomicrobiales bacterium]|nr:FAD-dependent oxidoreductase [Thermomicrobiales bacterium]
MTKKILIVGGGFAGFWAAMAARRVAGQQVAVTMLSREPVLQLRPRLYEANPEALGVDLMPLLATVGVDFVAGEAIGLNPVGKHVELATGERLGYDRLVIATGSVMRRPPVAGADVAFSIDTQADAIAFDRRLREIARTTSQPSIAVVGAGFTGIELALEMRTRLAIHGGDEVAERAAVTLIDREPVVGFELGEGPRSEIEAALAAARIELLLGATVTELAADRLVFADGTVRAADAVVLTTGMVAAPFVSQVPGDRDRLGRLVVDSWLRAPAAPDIFVTGDAAAADTGEGYLTLQSCQHALTLGPFAGENVARDLLGLPLLPYAQPRYVTCLDLGRFGAVYTDGWDRIVRETGDVAKARKRRINTVVIYPPANATGEQLLELSTVSSD